MSQLNDFQKRLLETFKVFDEFCQENNIMYYSAYGTLIGVIRHQGFIPWDDDIDVLMKREDYNKILEIKEKLFSTNYRIGSMVDKNYPYSFAKFYSTNGAVQEYEHFPFVIGPWIDIFPMDECDFIDESFFSLLDKLNYYHWKYRKSISYNPIKEIIRDLSYGNFIDAGISVIKKLRYHPFSNYYRKKFLQVEKEISKFHGEYYRTEADLRENAFKKGWFDEIIRMRFEDMYINIPIGYDELLKLCYGEYMKLPPEDKRVSNHNLYFFDLEHKYTWNEIRAKAPKSTRKQLSIKTIWNELVHRKGF